MRKYVSLSIFVIAFVFTFVKVRSFDLFFYLKVAQTESLFSPLKVNLFSYSHPDFPYNNYSFLYSELAYFLTENLSINWLIVLQCTVISLSYIIITKSAEYKRSAILLFTVFLISLFTLRYRLLFRPHNLSYIFFAINLFLLTRMPNRYLIYLFINQILWVNTHNGFILGIINAILLYPYLKGRISLKKILLVLLSGSLVSPHFYKPFIEVVNPFLGMTKNIFDYIKVHEWQQADERLYFSFYGLLIVFSFIIMVRDKKWRLLPFYLFYLIISVRFVRFIDFFAFAGFFAVISTTVKKEGLNGTENIKIKKIFRLAQISFLITVFFFCVKDYFQNHLIPYGYGLADYFYPSSAVDYLRKNDLKGNIFNTYAFGGYLIYNLYPNLRPIIDGRLCYPLDFVKLYADAHEDRESFNKIIAKYKPDIFLIDFDHPKLALFITDLKDQFALTYFDDNAMIFLDRNKFKSIVEKDEYKFLKPLYVSGYSEEKDTKNVKLELEKKLKEKETNRAKVIYGNLLLKEGNISQAEKIFENVVNSKTPIGKAEAYNNLGVIKISEGSLDLAKKLFKKALSFDSNMGMAHLNLAQVYDEEKSYFSAYYHYREFIKNSEEDVPSEIEERVSFLRKYVFIQSMRILIIFLATSGIFLIITRRIIINRR
ncbi:MAG: hypothetical protein N2999_01995 [Proteobacteria bacterium]|nr:hypothetical protein [Pseudomonadota bacterium]